MKKQKYKIVVYSILSLMLLILLFSSFYIVGAGERGVLVTLGAASLDAKEPGLHIKWPIIQRVIDMDVKTQKYESKASAASSDLQTVSATIAVNYRLSSDATPVLYKDIGLDYQDRVIQPAVQEAVKATTAQFSAEELITKRGEVKDRILSQLRDRLLIRSIVIEDVSITNFDFSKSFNNAIENKVTAEQNALAAKNKLEQIEYEKLQRITQAEGEAEAIRIQAAAIQVQGGVDYVKLQAIAKWDGKMPTYTGGPVPFIAVA